MIMTQNSSSAGHYSLFSEFSLHFVFTSLSSCSVRFSDKSVWFSISFRSLRFQFRVLLNFREKSNTVPFRASALCRSVLSYREIQREIS